MALPVWLLGVRKVLGKLTDYLTMGRAAGLWNTTGNPLGLDKPFQGAPKK